MENCPSHKTPNAIKLINSLKIPTLFSAPASYLVAPIERLFGALKSFEFDRKELPSILKMLMPSAEKFTHTQMILSKISEYLLRMQERNIIGHFKKSFSNLGRLLRLIPT
jgi:hypothetical protein